MLLLTFWLLGVLWSAPEDLDVFIDFENTTGEGDFVIGQSPNRVRFIGFTLQSTNDPDLSHSGTKSLIIETGEEGKIIFERGVNLLQFYAAETNGEGRIELRDKNAFILHKNGVAVSLPTSISPQVNPVLHSFIAFSGNLNDGSDLNYTNGIKTISLKNVSGQIALDDLGFSYVDGPPNNTLYEDFENIFSDPQFEDPENFTLGESPITATFTGGLAREIGVSRTYNHTFPFGDHLLSEAAWGVYNGTSGTITFETPAAQVQFYASVYDKDDGEIRVFDSHDNLIGITTKIPNDISIEVSTDPIPFYDINAIDLGAPDGIGKIEYINKPQNSLVLFFNYNTIDDFGFTPITVSDQHNIPDEVVITGSGEIVGTNILHPNGNIFDQVLITGEKVTLRADNGQITRASFVDINDDIVQVEFSGAGTVAINLDPDTLRGPATPRKYMQDIAYVKGHPHVVLSGADETTYLSIFTVGPINAEDQTIFIPGEDYDAVADISFIEVINSNRVGGIHSANARFSNDTGKVGFFAPGVEVAVRVLIGEIDAREEAIPYLLFGDQSFTVNAAYPGLRITGGDLAQSNGKPIIVAPGKIVKGGFDALISQRNIKSDNTLQPARNINAEFVNESGDEVIIIVVENSQ